MKNLDCKNIIFLLLCLIIFLRPFISDEAFINAGLLYKFLLFSILLASILIYPKSLFKNNPLNLSILLLILIYLFSLFYHRNFNDGLRSVFNLLGGVSLFYLVYSQDKNKINILIKVIISASIIISIYGIYQYFWGFERILEYLFQLDPSILEREQRYVEKILISKRVYSTFFSPTTLAGYLIMVIPLIAGIITKKLKNRSRFITPIESPTPRSGDEYRSTSLYLEKVGSKVPSFLTGFTFTLLGFALFVTTLTLFLTKSILGILSFIISSGILLFLVIRYIVKSKLLKRRLIQLTVVTFVLLFILFGCVLFIRKHHAVDLHRLDWSIMQRRNYLISTVEMIKENPLVGVGLGNYGKAYLRFIQPGANVTVFAHNSYLQIWAETGIFGLLVFLSIIILFLKNGMLLIKRENIYAGLNIGLFTAGLAFLIHCVVDNNFFITQVAYHWWIILGILMNQWQRTETREQKPEKSDF